EPDPLVGVVLFQVGRKLPQARDKWFTKTLPIQVYVKHGIANTVLLKEFERLARRKASKSVGLLDEVLRNVVAVGIDQRHPVYSRAEHVPRASEPKMIGNHGKLETRSIRQGVENAIRRLDRRYSRQPQRHCKLDRRDSREKRGRERGSWEPLEQRCKRQALKD